MLMEPIKGGRRMTDERNIKLNDEIMALIPNLLDPERWSKDDRYIYN